MKISVITTITNPEERQDCWREAISCFCDFADEVIVVNGGDSIDDITVFKWLAEFAFNKIKFIKLKWPEEWNWFEMTRHLNAGREQVTGDWIFRMDMDYFIHENEMKRIRGILEKVPEDCDEILLQKFSTTYGNKYYSKGAMQIAFRNKEYIKFGQNTERFNDITRPIRVMFERKVIDAKSKIEYKLPVGITLKQKRTDLRFWNYDYFVKTEEKTKEEFWRFAKAFQRYFGEWRFGETKEEAFKLFLDMMKSRHDKSPYNLKLEDHPKYMKEVVKNLTKDQFGHSGWGVL